MYSKPSGIANFLNQSHDPSRTQFWRLGKKLNCMLGLVNLFTRAFLSFRIRNYMKLIELIWVLMVKTKMLLIYLMVLNYFFFEICFNFLLDSMNRFRKCCPGYPVRLSQLQRFWLDSPQPTLFTLTKRFTALVYQSPMLLFDWMFMLRYRSNSWKQI